MPDCRQACAKDGAVELHHGPDGAGGAVVGGVARVDHGLKLRGADNGDDARAVVREMSENLEDMATLDDWLWDEVI